LHTEKTSVLPQKSGKSARGEKIEAHHECGKPVGEMTGCPASINASVVQSLGT
jgi:hypothetical protein